ncbi:MAG: hypothetical protein M0T70_00810 [Geobacteraceae bacterium]|nr:hypothetical protein [Geobacteraceae bacterium]
MKRISVYCLVLSLGLTLDVSGAWAIDAGWMQPGVRVWYFGSAGSTTSSDGEEAYLFTSISDNTAQLTHHSGISHWSMPSAETVTGSIVDQGPFWIHPQALQTIAVGDTWQGIRIASMTRATYTYDSFKSNTEFNSIPYLLLPIKALFDLQPQREIVKLVYGIPYMPGYPVWGTAYFDAGTGLCLFNLRLTVYNTVWFLLSEINYNFATQAAFAEDTGPHTGFRSNTIKTKSAIYTSHMLQMLASVESRYGGTLQMWTTTQAGGASSSYFGRDENYCFFGSVPVLRHKLMSATPNYPPENWNAYGEYLWWWLPAATLQNSTINVFGVPMTRTSTSPYTFTAAAAQGGLYFSGLIFDDDGYMTDFSAKDPSIGLDLDVGTLIDLRTTVDGLSYYKNTMGRAVPPEIACRLTLTVISDTAGKGGGSVHGAGNIACSGFGSDPTGMSGTCQADFPSGTDINLYQTPDADSTWATWTASGCGTNQSCQVLMSGARDITVSFPYSFMARVSSSNQGSESLSQAYGYAAQVDTIYGRACTFAENLTLGDSKALTLLGGRDAWYQPQNAWTTLRGKLTIRNGSLKVARLAIKSAL